MSRYFRYGSPPTSPALFCCKKVLVAEPWRGFACNAQGVVCDSPPTTFPIYTEDHEEITLDRQLSNVSRYEAASDDFGRLKCAL